MAEKEEDLDFMAFTAASLAEREDDSEEDEQDPKTNPEPKLTEKQEKQLKKIGAKAKKRATKIMKTKLGENGEKDADDGTNERKKKKRKRTPNRVKTEKKRGVVYIGHIPHGFYEREMRQFFRQFGDITRLRLSRNKKTKRSKGYAFIEFKHSEVANVVAETFDGYMMFGRTLIAKRVPYEKVNRNTFLGCDKSLKELTTPIDYREMDIAARRKPRSKAQHAKRVDRLVQNERRLRKKLKESGVDYDFEGYEEKRGAVAKRTVF